MQSSENAANELLKRKVAQSVDVSGFSDNCFFHNLVLYYLGNDIPLPEDLFTINDSDHRQIRALKTRFPNLESFDLFEQYATLKFPDANIFHRHLVEKTMVLGIFFRNWFIKNLAQDAANREALFQYEGAQEAQGVDENHITFMSLLQGYRAALFEDIVNENKVGTDTFKLQVEHNPIYQANLDFFRTLSTEEQEGDEQLYKLYWEERGYQSYCAYLGANVKLSHSDVGAVFRTKLNLPYVVYSRADATSVTRYEVESEYPVFETAIDAGTGHYFLLKNENTEQFVDEYALQQETYKEHRSLVLQTVTDIRMDKVAQAKQRPAILLAATLPFLNTYRQPIDLLLEEIQQLDEYILNPVVVVEEVEEVIAPVLAANSNAQPLAEVRNASGEEPLESTNQLRRNSEPKAALTGFETLDSTERTLKRGSSAPQLLFSRRLGVSTSTPKTALTENEVPRETVPQRNTGLPDYQDEEVLNDFTPIVDSEDEESVPQAKTINRGLPPKTEDVAVAQHIEKLKTHIAKLKGKAVEFQRKLDNPPADLRTFQEISEYRAKYRAANYAANQLHTSINDALTIYLDSKRTIEDFDTFKEASIEAVDLYKPTLEVHRDDNQFYANLSAAILGVGVIYGLVIVANVIYNGLQHNRWQCSFFQTDAEQKTWTVVDDINELEELTAAPAA